MATLIENYDIHNLVSIKVYGPKTLDFVTEISQPLRYFQVANLDNEPDIILEIGDFEPDNQGCYLVDHQFYVRENYLYCEDSYRSAQWRVEIKGFEYGQTHIRIWGTYRNLKQLLAPGMFWESLLLKQIIAFHLTKKGYYLVHGAAVSKDEQAIILFGRGGTYKTTLLMNLLRQNNGWMMMGDDTVIVGHGQVLSFPALAGIFAFRYQYLPTEHLSTLNRFRLLLFLTNFNPQDLPAIKDHCGLAGLIHCAVGRTHDVELKETNVDENILRLIKVSATEDHSNYNIGHTSIFPRYVEAYSYVFPGNSLMRRWQDAEKRLLSQAAEIQSLALNIPQSPDSVHFAKAVQTITTSSLKTKKEASNPNYERFPIA